MARASIGVQASDGGIGYTGPVGPSRYAVIGVASGAGAIAAQGVVTITNPQDVESLVGIGPLRDLAVTSLQRSGGTILAMPLERNSGGEVLDGEQSSGTVEVTAVAGHALGEQHVRLECVVAGAAGTAEFRLVVDGVVADNFKPSSGDFAAAIVLTEAQLGSLATGVAAANRFSPTIATNTAFVAGDAVEFQMGQARGAGASLNTAVSKLSDHEIAWQWVELAGASLPASWALLNTAVSGLSAQGRYVHASVQAAGHDLRTGATAATAVTMAEHVSALAAGLAEAPARSYDPRLRISINYVNTTDPISGRDKVWPAQYALAAHLAARQIQEHPDAVKYGPLRGVKSIYGGFSGAQADTLDDLWYTTLTTYPGVTGIFPTHYRMWGIYPQTGVQASDFTGVERRRIMDGSLTAVYNALFPFINAEIDTTPTGRMTALEQTQLAGRAVNSLRNLRRNGAITFASATVTDKDPGILVTGTIQAVVRITPRGKAEAIEGEVTFYTSEEVAAAEVAA